MQIETERLILRRLNDADAPALFQTVGDPEVMRYWRVTDKTEDDALNRIQKMEKHWEMHGFGDLAVVEKETDELIGFCGVHHIDFMAEVNIGYAFKKVKWRQGFGYESGKAALAFGFHDMELDFITAVIEKPNIASRNLAQKLSLTFWKEFSNEGRDLIAYGKTLKDFLNHKN